MRALFMPAQSQGGYERGRRFEPNRRSNGGDWRSSQRLSREPLAALRAARPEPAGPRLRSAISPREALILLSVIEHPWLLETHTEEFAELEFFHPDADQLAARILDAAHGEAVLDPKALQAGLSSADWTRCWRGSGRR